MKNSNSVDRIIQIDDVNIGKNIAKQKMDKMIGKPKMDQKFQKNRLDFFRYVSYDYDK